jgi:hypothetical protein
MKRRVSDGADGMWKESWCMHESRQICRHPQTSRTEQQGARSARALDAGGLVNSSQGFLLSKPHNQSENESVPLIDCDEPSSRHFHSPEIDRCVNRSRTMPRRRSRPFELLHALLSNLPIDHPPLRSQYITALRPSNVYERAKVVGDTRAHLQAT